MQKSQYKSDSGKCQAKVGNIMKKRHNIQNQNSKSVKGLQEKNFRQVHT